MKNFSLIYLCIWIATIFFAVVDLAPVDPDEVEASAVVGPAVNYNECFMIANGTDGEGFVLRKEGNQLVKSTAGIIPLQFSLNAPNPRAPRQFQVSAESQCLTYNSDSKVLSFEDCVAKNRNQIWVINRLNKNGTDALYDGVQSNVIFQARKTNLCLSANDLAVSDCTRETRMLVGCVGREKCKNPSEDGTCGKLF